MYFLPHRRIAQGFLTVMSLAWVGRAQSVGDLCPVELSGLPSDAWQRAVKRLKSTLAAADCERVQVAVREDGALLTFDTIDGRRASRELAEPSELQTTVEALLVTLPDTIHPAKVPSDNETSASGPPTRSGNEVDDSGLTFRSENLADSPRPLLRNDPGALFGLQLGARGGANALLSPVLTGIGALTMGRWEVGVVSAIEFQYFDLKRRSDDRKSSAVLVGATAARREPLGELDILAGVRLSFAALLHREADRGSGEARGGVFVGAAFPRSSKTRFRADLAADARTDQGDRPITPGWAITALFGVEVGGT